MFQVGLVWQGGNGVDDLLREQMDLDIIKGKLLVIENTNIIKHIIKSIFLSNIIQNYLCVILNFMFEFKSDILYNQFLIFYYSSD